ncbi:hypothetical protein NQ314_010268 [Rhamnusium bicolor]|uniref:Microsomal glutathione S-transferase 1 n=1 Tax=Rhamnusium bicolor TaxID=1586634 RepID=A0AAV8XTF3_9CUCU|nr:hypothetical protein NQ314_010268 [Rhamnusium bicolor]
MNSDLLEFDVKRENNDKENETEKKNESDMMHKTEDDKISSEFNVKFGENHGNDDEEYERKMKTINATIFEKTEGIKISETLTVEDNLLKKTKEKCSNCDELDSDTNENDLKNVGCDKCSRRFHLKCTDFYGQLNEDIINKVMAVNDTGGAVNVDVISITNPAFCSYLICVSLLILKMMGTTLLTILHRMRTKSFISDEDAAWKGGEVKQNEHVERTRRAYQNDLENIPLFFITSLGYLWTRPPLWVVNTLFITYLITRALHTFVYAIYVIRQPTRAILWAIGFIILGYMTIHTALYAFIKLL